MNPGPGAAGLLWLWATVAELVPGDPSEPPPRPAPDRDHGCQRPADVAAP
jgi:hypothetical protein